MGCYHGIKITALSGDGLMWFMNKTGDHLFGLPLLEIGRELSLEDKAVHGVLHAIYGNFLLLTLS